MVIGAEDAPSATPSGIFSPPSRNRSLSVGLSSSRVNCRLPVTFVLSMRLMNTSFAR